MSAVCVLTPVIVTAWPAFSAAVTAAATSLGYAVVAGTATSLGHAVVAETAQRMREATEAAIASKTVQLEIDNSELVTGELARDQRISVTRDGVTVTFSRDARGKAQLCVTGAGCDNEALRAIGEELSKRVVQQYVYQRLIEELRARKFHIVEEEVESNQAIRLRVRQWET